eukprot:CAMPEP_0173230824 /NCGR_PEP_ID=MMETSP1142-20121109/7993_1 /TAXON_ID=483371 /ORGANISM="non described non described, Strain CCMP2298" /LENGTH=157 /DNA_ID=CAMNT_0014160013 /DNA_START=245 /DNA_END=714 /DNA_ORIENTATION=-
MLLLLLLALALACLQPACSDSVSFDGYDWFLSSVGSSCDTACANSSDPTQFVSCSDATQGPAALAMTPTQLDLLASQFNLSCDQNASHTSSEGKFPTIFESYCLWCDGCNSTCAANASAVQQRFCACDVSFLSTPPTLTPTSAPTTPPTPQPTAPSP